VNPRAEATKAMLRVVTWIQMNRALGLLTPALERQVSKTGERLAIARRWVLDVRKALFFCLNPKLQGGWTGQ